MSDSDNNGKCIQWSLYRFYVCIKSLISFDYLIKNVKYFSINFEITKTKN